MPVMGGREAARFYRFAHPAGPRLPIVALSADARPEAIGNCEEFGFDAYLTKPVEAKKLLSVLDELLPAVGRSAEGLSRRADVQEPGVQTHRDVSLVVNPATLRDLEALDEQGGFLSELIHAFLSDGEETLGAVESAAAALHLGQFRELAHAFQGSAGSIGATVLQEQASECARLGYPEFSAEGSSRVRRLKSEFAFAEVVLKSHTETREAAAL